MTADFSILWLVAEDNGDDFLLLQRACSRITPQPKLHRVKDGLQAKCYLAGTGVFGNRTVFPLPSLILSDLKMPFLDGFELLGWVKTQPGLRRIPFVILTCSNVQRDWDRAHELGTDGYLVKPTDFIGFTKVLQEVVCARPKRPDTSA